MVLVLTLDLDAASRRYPLMAFRVLKNTPLRPLADQLRALTQHADAVWIATAFVSQVAVEDIIGSAITAGTTVRFLTGTFGNVTRRRTFNTPAKMCLASAGNAEAESGEVTITQSFSSSEMEPAESHGLAHRT